MLGKHETIKISKQGESLTEVTPPQFPSNTISTSQTTTTELHVAFCNTECQMSRIWKYFLYLTRTNNFNVKNSYDKQGLHGSAVD